MWLDDEPWRSPPEKYPSALLRAPDGSATGLSVDAHAPLSDRFDQVEDVVRQAVIEARAEVGLPGNWPRCPDHPTKHPLSLNGNPWPTWCCPWTDDRWGLLPLPSWAVTMLKRRRKLMEDDVEPIFPDSLGGWRDPSNVRRVWRGARDKLEMDGVASHTLRKTEWFGPGRAGPVRERAGASRERAGRG
jgi:hypothetical protein